MATIRPTSIEDWAKVRVGDFIGSPYDRTITTINHEEEWFHMDRDYYTYTFAFHSNGKHTITLQGPRTFKQIFMSKFNV